jgi:hypothetical protein
MEPALKNGLIFVRGETQAGLRGLDSVRLEDEAGAMFTERCPSRSPAVNNVPKYLTQAPTFRDVCYVSKTIRVYVNGLVDGQVDEVRLVVERHGMQQLGTQTNENGILCCQIL